MCPILLVLILADALHIPPASVDTVPELAQWVKTHPYQHSVAIDNQSSTVSARSTSPEAGGGKGTESGDFPQDGRDTPLRPVSQQPFQSYFFPVSNSPVDMVTMLTRLACFTGSIVSVLTPRLPRSSLRTGSNVSLFISHMMPGYSWLSLQPSHEYAPEIAQAREQAKLLLTNAENNRTEFLKKMHRVRAAV